MKNKAITVQESSNVRRDFDDIAKLIKENHSYDVHSLASETLEIVQMPITDGTPEYLKWIGDCTLTKDCAF